MGDATGLRGTMGSKIALTLACAVATVGLWAWWDLTIDDAYITFRYSQHLAEGHGPVWNVGGDPVQGYTNLLWMLLLTPAAWAGWSLPVAAKILGIAAMAGTVTAVHLAAADWSGQRWAGIASAVALLAMAPTWVHTLAGLETMLYAGLLVAFVWLASRRSGWGAVGAGVALGMCRPEGWAVAGAGMLWMLWRDHDYKVLTMPAAGTVVAGWQWWLYGYPVPNTAFVKGAAVGASPQATWAVVGVATLAIVCWVAGVRHRERWWVAGALVTAAAPYLVSTLSMGYASRFAFHLTPLAIAAAVAGAASMRRASVALVASVFVLVGAVAVEPWLGRYGPDLRGAHVELGDALSQLPDGLSLAVGDAGAIPYYSGMETVDLLGLNDERIAHGRETPAGRIVEERVDVLAVRMGPDGVPRAASAGDLDGVLDRYRLAGTVAFRGDYLVAVLGGVWLPEATHGRLRAAAQGAPAK